MNVGFVAWMFMRFFVSQNIMCPLTVMVKYNIITVR